MSVTDTPPPSDPLVIAAKFQNRITGIVIATLCIAVFSLAMVSLAAVGYGAAIGRDNEELRRETACRSKAAVDYDVVLGQGVVIVLRGLGAVASSDQQGLADLADDFEPVAAELELAIAARENTPETCGR